MKLISIVGARPQFIKMAAFHRYLLNQQPDMEHIILHTGQHYSHNMNQVFFDEMDLPDADYNLGINNAGHGAMTARMLEGIEKVLLDSQPDFVIIYGDTNSTLAGALAASKLHIPVAHIEAGLRSFNWNMPEEINRIIADKISDLLFCPSKSSSDQLIAEGINKNNVFISGDIMQEAFNYYSHKKAKPDFLLPEQFVLCTVHRAENTDNLERLTEICEIINDINKQISVVIPAHPRLLKRLEQSGLQLNCKLIAPQSYFQMLYLLDKCRFVMTDSGGLQKEAFWSKKYCITLRDETEWTELVEHKVNFLTGINREGIFTAMASIFVKEFDNRFNDTYGDGKVSEKIIEAIGVATERMLNFER